MSEDAYGQQLHTLLWLQKCYQKTENPLHVWQALACCLCDDPPVIPSWCLNYLRSVGNNLFDLSRGKDFRRAGSARSKLSADQAFQMIPQALFISKRGKRNAFAWLLKDRDSMIDANTSIFYNAKAKEVARYKKQKGHLHRTRRSIVRGKYLLRD